MVAFAFFSLSHSIAAVAYIGDFVLQVPNVRVNHVYPGGGSYIWCQLGLI